MEINEVEPPMWVFSAILATVGFVTLLTSDLWLIQSAGGFCCVLAGAFYAAEKDR